jgi:hypothetical protein
VNTYKGLKQQKVFEKAIKKACLVNTYKGLKLCMSSAKDPYLSSLVNTYKGLKLAVRGRPGRAQPKFGEYL